MTMYAAPYLSTANRDLVGTIDDTKAIRTIPRHFGKRPDFFVGADFTQAGELLWVFGTYYNGTELSTAVPLEQEILDDHISDLEERLGEAKELRTYLSNVNAWTTEKPEDVPFNAPL
jgi:hypothetical protein